MKLGLEFGEECLHRLNAVVHVGVDTSNRRFSSFAHWFAERTGKSVAVTYMSNVSRQMSARLGDPAHVVRGRGRPDESRIAMGA